MPIETTGIGGIEEAAGSLFFLLLHPDCTVVVVVVLEGGTILGRRIDVWESGKGIASSVLSPVYFWVLAWVLPIPLTRVAVFQPRFPSWGRGTTRVGSFLVFHHDEEMEAKESHDSGGFHA